MYRHALTLLHKVLAQEYRDTKVSSYMLVCLTEGFALVRGKCVRSCETAIDKTAIDFMLVY